MAILNTRLGYGLAAISMLLASPGSSALQSQQAQMQRMEGRPMKLDVRPLAQGTTVGSNVNVSVLLLDANNQPAKSTHEYQVELEVTNPSAGVQKYTATVSPGQTTAQFSLPTSEVGVVSLNAHEKDDTLLPGGNSVLVRPTTPTKTIKKKKAKRSAFLPGDSQPRFISVAARSRRAPVLMTAAYRGQQPPSPSGPTAASPELLITDSSGKDEFLADGKDFARITVYFMDPQGGTAPTDINVWLTWTHGLLTPQPLIIKKGETSAEAHLVSNAVAEATVSAVPSAPSYRIKYPSKDHHLTFSFLPPIYEIFPAGANPLKLSMVDAAPIVAQFLDAQQRAIQTSKKRQVTFVSSDPWLYVDPTSSEVQPNESGASAILMPTWGGTTKLDVWTPGYDHQTLVVEVSMWLVLVLCLAGGVAGGIAAKGKLKASVPFRIFVGILGSIVLVWICVYAVLPKTHSVIAHNLVSVLVVGIVGGYGGTQVLDFAGKKLGYL